MTSSSVKPLLFLTLRSVVNGIKRSLSSARRLIGLLFGLSWYVMQIMRPWDHSQDHLGEGLSKLTHKATLPNLAVFEPYVFLGFAFISLFLSLGILSYRGVFRPADVDVLFPTPVNPKVVLLFRIVRDYLLTLFLPLLLVLFGGRGTVRGLQFLFTNYPKYGAYAFRAGLASWLLLSLSWVAIGYAASLFVNRSDHTSERNRKVILALITLPPLLLALYIAYQLRGSMTLETFRSSLENPLGRILFPTASAASALTMAPLTGNLAAGAVGGIFLFAVCGVFLWLATTQAGWMYDQAAARGFDDINMKALARKGDLAAVHAEQARRGKVKKGRVAARLSKWRVQGAWALLWKEAVLQARTSMAQIYLFVVIGVGMMGLMTWASAHETKSDTPIAAMFWMFGGMFTFIIIQINAQIGFVEVLRRVDLQKPLPFSPGVTVAGEVGGKSLQTLAFLLPYCLATLLLQPGIWIDVLVAIPLLFSVACVLSSSALLVTILFPDIDDPTQRSFRGMMQLLATVITLAPGIAIFASIYVFLKSPAGAFVTIPLNLGIAAALAWGSGALYANFNPNE